MDRLLLTGAAGFAGSHMLRHLLQTTDYEIVCPVTFTHRGVSDRIDLALNDIPDTRHRVTVVRCDLASPISPVTDHRFGHIDYVVNYASQSHVDRSITDPGPFIANNVALITNLLDWFRSRDEPPKVFVQISTDEVYGPAPGDLAHSEWLNLHLPSNPYAASKAAQESIAFSYWRTYGVPLVITNTMNLIGETQDSEKFVPMTLKKVLSGSTMTIHSSPYGDIGSRYYLHARNQADGVLYAMRYALENPITPDTLESLVYGLDDFGYPYRFNIVGEREIDNLEMAQRVADAAGRELHYQLTDFHSSRPGHDLRYALDGGKMSRIGWKPPVPLQESLQKTVDWTRSHPEWLRS